MTFREPASLNIFFDMSGEYPRISRIVYDSGEGKAITKALKYNASQGLGYLHHVRVTKVGGAENVARE